MHCQCQVFNQAMQDGNEPFYQGPQLFTKDLSFSFIVTLFFPFLHISLEPFPQLKSKTENSYWACLWAIRGNNQKGKTKPSPMSMWSSSSWSWSRRDRYNEYMSRGKPFNKLALQVSLFLHLLNVPNPKVTSWPPLIRCKSCIASKLLHLFVVLSDCLLFKTLLFHLSHGPMHSNLKDLPCFIVHWSIGLCST